MNAMQAIQRSEFEIEAEAYCRRHIPNASYEDVQRLADSLRHRAFMEAIEPLLKAKARMYNVTLPKVTIDLESGAVNTEYKFSAEAQAILDECDRQIAALAERYGATSNTARCSLKRTSHECSL
jgi:predicted metal-dependent hydrolase